MRTTVCMCLLLGITAFTAACGGPQRPIDKDEIRRNADGADRDLDRESNRQRD